MYNICMRTVSTEKRLKCFLKGDRGGRVDDFGAQGVVKFRSLVAIVDTVNNCVAEWRLPAM